MFEMRSNIAMSMKKKKTWKQNPHKFNQSTCIKTKFMMAECNHHRTCYNFLHDEEEQNPRNKKKKKNTEMLMETKMRNQITMNNIP